VSVPGVKVCGLTIPEQAAQCAALGAWGIGVVLAEESSRRLDPQRAARVLSAVPAGVARVGVFVGGTTGYIARVAAGCGMTHVQLHGVADPVAVARATGITVIEAVAVDGPAAIDRARASRADLVLLDGSVAGRHGGTGVSFDWEILAARPLGRPFLLAGGLTPENVADAVARVRPDVVDVSSGVEERPGVKDLALVRRFIEQARGATGSRAA
jgi:phosphoribosylanthranilate isomerase